MSYHNNDILYLFTAWLKANPHHLLLLLPSIYPKKSCSATLVYVYKNTEFIVNARKLSQFFFYGIYETGDTAGLPNAYSHLVKRYTYSHQQYNKLIIAVWKSAETDP